MAVARKTESALVTEPRISWFPVYLALGYITASLFLGPALAVVGVGSIPGEGDDCNPGFALDAAGVARMTAAYRRSQIFMDTGAGIMLAVGLLVLAHLWVRHRRISWAGLIVSTVGILMMVAGYVAVIIFAMPGYQGPASCLGPVGPS